MVLASWIVICKINLTECSWYTTFSGVIGLALQGRAVAEVVPDEYSNLQTFILFLVLLGLQFKGTVTPKKSPRRKGRVEAAYSHTRSPLSKAR